MLTLKKMLEQQRNFSDLFFDSSKFDDDDDVFTFGNIDFGELMSSSKIL
jgi:hypothetical protein